jgi:signal transduction histidine kinase
MVRLSLAARLTLIVVVALTAAWLGAIAISFRSNDVAGRGARPSPRQIAALVHIIEQAPGEERPIILQAVTSSTLDVRLEPGPAQLEAAGGVAAVGDDLRESYRAVLGDRLFSIESVPVPPGTRRFRRLNATALRPLEFRIALKTGDTLVVDTKSPVGFTTLGLPVGFGAGLFGTVVALVALLIMQRATRPLSRLAAAVDGMDIAGPPTLLPEVRAAIPEIRALISAFNRLQSRLAFLLRARMALLGGISHDVRTYATRLRLRIDKIPQGAERDRAIGDIADMIRLLDDALLASRAGAGELAEELVEMGELVRAEVEDRRTLGAAIDFRATPDAAHAVVLGDRLALRRVVSNLADNALKYGHVAHLALETDGGMLVLIVDDEGAGIPPDRREMLLEPFVRAEASRNRGTGGAGLGLSIVRSLVEAHGGTMTIGDVPTGGARLKLSLPAFNAR